MVGVRPPPPTLERKSNDGTWIKILYKTRYEDENERCGQKNMNGGEERYICKESAMAYGRNELE